MRRRALLVAVLSLALPAAADAQGLSYPAAPPTAGGLYSGGQSGRFLLGGTWLYRADPTDVGLGQAWWRDVSATDGWSAVSIPNAYNAGDLSSASMSGYVGWYRKDFTLPAGAFAGHVRAAWRHWIVRFESVNYRATVWLNGRQLGSHAGAYLPFEFDLNGVRAGVNRLIVRVDDRRGPADLPPGPSGGWWNYGGLLREVYLRAVQIADVQQLELQPALGCAGGCTATIDLHALVRNLTGARQTVHMRGAYGTAPVDFGTATIAPYGSWSARAVAQIDHPRLWWPDHPVLYQAHIELSDSSGRPLQHDDVESGIRTVTVAADGRLELNGRLLNLRGFNLHEQDLAHGAALDQAHLARLLRWVKALGATLIRAHYPLGPEVEQLADHEGVLIWSEIPVYQVRSQYLGDPGWLARAHAMLADDILEGQNHPSVLLWSIANELTTPATAAETSYIAGAAALARRLDPTRPVAMAVSGWPGVACQPAYAPLDVVGYNDYFGWFDAGGGTTDDRDALGPFLDSLRACYPSKALFVSEFGFDGNREGPVEERGTYEFQSDSVAYHLGVFASKRWLSGAIYFLLQDYAARPGWGGGNPVPNPPFVQKGMLDLQGDAKPAFAVVAAIYHATVQIARASR